jgi:hypothetical protein
MSTLGYYALYTDNVLLYLKNFPNTEKELINDVGVKGFWPFDPLKRITLWTLLVEAGAAGAPKLKIKEIVLKHQCNDEDGKTYLSKINFEYQELKGKDFKPWYFVYPKQPIENKPYSYGSGNSILEACINLAQNLGFEPSKISKEKSFVNLAHEKALETSQ